VRSLHHRLLAHEDVALRLQAAGDPSTPEARAEAVRVALALVVDALGARHRLGG
jgi:hypothetical protein